MAGKRKANVQESVLHRVLALTTEAMDALDAHGADPEAAAYIALAQQQLRKTIADLK